MQLPDKFIEQINNCGASQFSGLLDALQLSQPVVAVRLNSLKGVKPAEGNDIVPWCRQGVYLPRRGTFTFDPRMHQGLYYVQDASSMFAQYAFSHAVDKYFPARKPLRILDACAAPGGKTGSIAAAAPEGSLIVANEMSGQRCQVLMENMAKQGIANSIVTHTDATAFGRLPGYFDVVLLDAPCSGEGMMRKEPVAVEQWSEQLVDSCATIQRGLVEAAWSALKPGGVLIYSTCTFNRRENEEVAELIASYPDSEPERIELDEEWNISTGINTALPCMRFIPGRTRGEGLFMVMFHKSGVAGGERPVKLPKKYTRPDRKQAAKASEWLTGSGDIELLADGDNMLHAIHKQIVAPLAALHAAGIPVAGFGTVVGEIKGTDLVPAQQLALSPILRREAFAGCDVDVETALAYLRREAVTLPEGTPTGFVLLYFAGYPLGFVKNLGKRANNLYPKPWRILSAGAPWMLPVELI